MMILSLVACAYLVDLDDTGGGRPPELTLSTHSADFGTVLAGAPTVTRQVTATNTGEWPMGVTLGIAGKDTRFCAHWVEGSNSCGDARRASAKDAADTAGPLAAGGTGGASRESGTGEDAPRCPDGAVEARPGQVLVLDPGCSIVAEADFTPTYPGGAALAGLEFGTADGPDDEWTRDPRDTVQDVRLDATVDVPGADAVWRAGTLAFPWHPPDGSTDTLTAVLQNPSSFDAGIGGIETSTCPAVLVVSGIAPGDTLPAGGSADVRLEYTATSIRLSCTVEVWTASTVADLTLSATPPATSDAPTLAVAAPLPADALVPGADLDVDFTVADDLESPTSLDVELSLDGVSVMSGLPSAGHDVWTLAGARFTAGPVTLGVVVTDFHGNRTRLAIPLRVGDPAADDADGDGWGTADLDCDDGDPTVYPYAVETEDGRDEDCDGAVDDETPVSDDDGDGFSEAAGDCDDGDAAIHPGLNEVDNLRDDDCDGRVDEDTPRGDDDGDGYAEVTGDCDDEDATVRPGAAELCDGIDNDCDGLKDQADGCPALTADPAFLDVRPDGCVPGEALTATLAVLPADAEVALSADDVDLQVTGATPTFTLTCPEATHRRTYGVYATTSIPGGSSAWTSARVAVYPEGEAPWGEQVGRGVSTPCNPSGAAAFSALVAGVLGAAALRRRGA